MHTVKLENNISRILTSIAVPAPYLKIKNTFILYCGVIPVTFLNYTDSGMVKQTPLWYTISIRNMITHKYV